MKNKTIQEQMTKLQELVDWFEGDDFSLELAKEKFLVAEQLASEVRQKLTELKNDISILEEKFDRD